MPMPAATRPSEEAERLATLRHYDFLAVLPDEVFHDLVGLAAQVFDLPISFIALVEEDEVVFPVQHGLPQVLLPQPRAQALCSSAILHPNAVAYENLATMAQTGPDAVAIRSAVALGNGFYAAAPLRMPDGRTIGVLCLMGPQPRPFVRAEEKALEAIAEVASLTIAVQHLCRATPELGADQWQAVCRHLRHDVHALRTHLRELLTKHRKRVPVPATVLHTVQRRLQALHIVLAE